MKIVCESCSAKYSIADEKVAGRAFRIRCKKCGAAIEVRGDQQPAESEAPAAASFDYGGEAVWHVAIGSEQQGPYTPAQLGQMIAEQQIEWDAFVWREGFDDWKPAQEIEELVAAIMNPGGGDAGAAEAHAGADHDDPFGAAGDADPFGGAANEPPLGASGGGGADLFAASEASPFGGGEDDVVSSSPGPRVSAQQAMTGQRNENSVLFSLSNLQALATGASSAPSSSGSLQAAPKPGMASGEGSGLIDIRALAAATGMGSSSSSMAAPEAPKVDDLISIGAPAVGLGSALSAPVIIADKTPERSGNGMLYGGIAIAVSVVAAAVILAVVMLKQPAATEAAPAAAAIATGVQPPVAPTAVEPAAAPAAPTVAEATAAVAPTTPTPAEPAAGAAEAEAAHEAAGTPSEGRASGSRASRRGGGGGGGGAAAAAESPAAAAAAPAAAPAARSGGARSGGDQSLEELLNLADRRGSSAARSGGSSGSSGAAASGPETPSRSDVQTAMNGVTPAVRACGAGQSGTATVAVTVTGSTGRVTNAVVSGQFAGTPVGSCIARAVRGATFPRFTRATFTVNYPFRI